MPQSSREIRRRIKSVKNIRQITKAMELVAAAKMRRAQSSASASRPYSQLTSELLQNLSDKISHKSHPLLLRILPEDVKVTPQHKNLMILVSSDRGLAGSLNTNLLNTAMKLLKEEGSEKFEFITVGKKGTDAVRRMNLNLLAVFPGKDKGLSILDARPIAKIAIEEFLKFKYDKIFVVYTDFISTLVQKPNLMQILPLARIPKDEHDERFTFEPNPDKVIEKLIRRTIEFQIFQSMLEAVASEHSARMVAMRNANQSAADLIEDLTLSANQARQAGITRELSEITAAKIAME